MKYCTIQVALCMALAISSCSDKEAQSIDGIWESVGYGRVVDIEEGYYVLADVTKFSCFPLMQGYIDEFGAALQLQNDTLSFKEGINRYYFTRLDKTPSICENDSKTYEEAKAKANDPEHNFEVLWDTFKNHYAYFELRGVTPKKMYAEYRPKVTRETSEAELFLILYEMLESFDDGHISLHANRKVKEAAKEIYKAQNPEEEEEDELEYPESYEVAQAVAEKYIPQGKSLRGNNLRWGVMENTIGYVQINEMAGMADYGIESSLSGDEYWEVYSNKSERSRDHVADELDGINKATDQLLKDFKETQALIIDLRFNGGGMDEVGMEVLKRFTGKERVVFTKKARFGDSYSPSISVLQPAVDEPYDRPVYLLMGPESASATEIMILSSLSIPNTTRIGSATEGVFSDVLEKTLPNGWFFGLSNEIYLDRQGNNYEARGIPPDFAIDYPRDTDAYLQKLMNDLEMGDACITKAVELIQ